MQAFNNPFIGLGQVPVFVPGYGLTGSAHYVPYGFICWTPAANGLFDSSTHFIYYSVDMKLHPKATVSPVILNPPATGFTLHIKQLGAYSHLTSAQITGVEQAYAPATNIFPAALNGYAQKSTTSMIDLFFFPIVVRAGII